MKRTSVLVCAGSVLALGLVPAAASPGGAATRTAARPSTTAGVHRTDPGFGPEQRRAAIAKASLRRSTTARQLRLDGHQGLLVSDVVRDVDGTEHVRYHRTYDGLPVIGGDLVVHQDAAGSPRTVDWASRDRIAVASTTPSVAARSVRGSDARKVVYAVDHTPVLAWETTVRGTAHDGTPQRDLVYTDARTGRQVGVLPQVETGTGNSLYSGTVGLGTSGGSGSFTLTDAARGGHKTYDATGITSETDYRTGTLFTDADDVWGDGTKTNKQSAAADAHHGAALTWDFYKNTFGRTGIRNDGVAAFSRVHFGNSYENAFWDDTCFCMTYGDGGTFFNPLVSIDVAGHEMSHGVTAATDGLVYSGDAGGLNEATSDVMGTMVEFSANNANDPGDYYIGEKIVKDGTYLRRMDRPSSDGASVDCWTTSTKNLDPHYSSGVGNHLFYLLSEGTGAKTIGGRPHDGSTCNGTTLTGIGRDAAAAEWYRAMTTYWTSTTTYPQAANGMIKAAKDLHGASSTECATTLAAWRAVGVSPTEACTTVPPSDGNLLANPGFESGATGWTATADVITSSTDAPPHSGSYYAWLDGYGVSHTDTVSQKVTIPAASAVTLTYWLRISSADTSLKAHDRFKVTVKTGTTAAVTVATYSNLDRGTGYVQRTVDLSAYAGKRITLKFTGVENATLATSFLLDDVSLTAH